MIFRSATLSTIIHQIHDINTQKILKVLAKKQPSKDSIWQVINYLNHKICSWMRMFFNYQTSDTRNLRDCCIICSCRIHRNEHFINYSILFVINMIRLGKIFHILFISSRETQFKLFPFIKFIKHYFCEAFLLWRMCHKVFRLNKLLIRFMNLLWNLCKYFDSFFVQIFV